MGRKESKTDPWELVGWFVLGAFLGPSIIGAVLLVIALAV